MDHDIVAIADTNCVLIAAAEMEQLLTKSSNLTNALWCSTTADSAVLRERIIDQGRRDWHERIAHSLYERLVRYRVVGGTESNSLPFSLTQNELADATGMTPVHVNRARTGSARLRVSRRPNFI